MAHFLTVNGNVPVTKTVKGTGGHAKTASRPHGKWVSKILSYPVGVDESGHGHYIIFRINEQKKAELKPIKEKTNAKFQERLAAEYKIHQEKMAGQIDVEVYRAERKKIKESLQGKIIMENVHKAQQKQIKGGGPQGSIQLQNPSTSRIGTAIALYMPPSINASYVAKWGETEIGAAAEATAGVIKGAMSGDFKGAMASGLSGVEQMVKQGALTALDTVAPGAKALLALDRGRVITPRVEMMFQSMGRREFSYEFNFIPKSEDESKIVEQIVLEFKKQMAADFMGGGIQGVREMSIPSTFDIEYMYKTKQNSHLHKIGTCVLENVSVSYGSDKYVTYAGGVPQATKVSLKFTEMEIMTRSRVMEGY